MISHAHRCIFIHIQRTAGSSIEKWIAGADWWTIAPATKHLIASQARALYAEHWNAYFKFAFVRDPVERVCSCLKYGTHFGLVRTPEGEIDFTGYHALYGSEVVLEHDQRFFARADLLTDRHIPGAVYGNILDEELDFIGRYESLEADLRTVQAAIGIETAFDHHIERSPARIAPAALPSATRDHIARIYRSDLERFGY